MTAIKILIPVLVLCVQAWAQSPGFVSGPTYLRPTAPSVAPGQLTTFVVSRLTGNAQVSAGSIPLPLSLAGVSAILRQESGASPLSVPMLSVSPFANCNSSVFPGALCGALTAITVQIPLEVLGTVPGYLSTPNLADITFLQNGTEIASFELNAVTDSIHVITDCDALITPSTSAPTGLCNPLAFHTDGAPVHDRAAVNGQTIVIYALGLGSVSPQPADGAASTGAAPVKVPIELSLNWSPNAQSLRLPYPTLITPSANYQTAAYAGLVPGSVGLYQINVVIPSAPSGVAGCGLGVFSNLTINLIGLSSIDSAAICVTP